MSDVKLILNSLNKDDQSVDHIIKRFENETGADIEEMVKLLFNISVEIWAAFKEIS